MKTPEEVAKEFLGGFDPDEWSFFEKDLAALIRERDAAVREDEKAKKKITHSSTVINITVPEPHIICVPVPGHPRDGDRR